MKAQPLKLGEGSYIHCEADEATHIMLCLPGPIPTRIIPVMIMMKRKYCVNCGGEDVVRIGSNGR